MLIGWPAALGIRQATVIAFHQLLAKKADARIELAYLAAFLGPIHFRQTINCKIAGSFAFPSLARVALALDFSVRRICVAQ
jgi:hypothetical protein